MEQHLNVKYEIEKTMRKIYPLLLTILTLGVISCKTASKAYDKGNYDQAVDLAVKKLQKNSNDRELKGILQNAYRYAVDEHESRIRQHSNSNNELRWENMYIEYAALQQLHDAIHRSPEAMSVVRPTDYSSYLETYRDKAADARYERGMLWMGKNDKQSYRQAYNEFQFANQFRPDDLTIRDRMLEAYDYAVTNVVVLPMDDYRYRFNSYNEHELRNIESELLRNLQYNTNNQFIKFHTQWDARNRNVRIDQFIDFRLSTMNMGRVKDEYSTREVSKDVVVKETVYRPDSIVKEYKKVFAKITTTKRVMQSDANMLVNIRNEGGQFLWSDNFRGDHFWTSEFATYTGDERALSEQDKELLNRHRAEPPQEQEIMRCIMEEITRSLQNRIRDYYNRAVF